MDICGLEDRVEKLEERIVALEDLLIEKVEDSMDENPSPSLDDPAEPITEGPADSDL